MGGDRVSNNFEEVSILGALRASVEHLPSVVEPLSDAQLDEPAYPAEWTIADVLSHIGSGATAPR